MPADFSNRDAPLSAMINSSSDDIEGFTSSQKAINLNLSSTFGRGMREFSGKGPRTGSEDMRIPLSLLSRNQRQGI